MTVNKQTYTSEADMMSKIDEIRARHEADTTFMPFEVYHDRTYLLERITELKAERDLYRNSVDNLESHIAHTHEPRIAELEAKLDRVCGIGQVHDSWNASDDFKRGWRDCLEQVKAALGDEE
jgi:hypothetical protein